MNTTPNACLNCGAVPTGEYCQSCGQRQGLKRFTFASLLHEIPHAIFHVDRGLPATLRQLARRPGEAIRGYLDGQRTKVFNPLTLLVLMAGMSAFLFSAFPFDYRMLISPEAVPAGASAEKYAEFMRQNFRFYSLTLVAYLPATALISWACFAGLWPERSRNYGEHLVINAYIMAFMSFLMVLAFPVLAIANGTPAFLGFWYLLTLGLLVYQFAIYYATFAAPGRRTSTAARSFASVLIYLVFVAISPQVFYFLIYVRL